LRVIGLTATPYRLDYGTICTSSHFLNHVCYEIGVKELIRDGYLSTLVTRSGESEPNFDKLSIRAREFVASDTEELMNADRLVDAACAELVDLTRDRTAVLIFATGIRHAEHIQRVLAENFHVECGLVTGDTPSAERNVVLQRFRGGALKYLVNV